jgi:hypothetical protein
MSDSAGIANVIRYPSATSTLLAFTASDTTFDP